MCKQMFAVLLQKADQRLMEAEPALDVTSVVNVVVIENF